MLFKLKHKLLQVVVVVVAAVVVVNSVHFRVLDNKTGLLQADTKIHNKCKAT
jgi:hypothetical protein